MPSAIDKQGADATWSSLLAEQIRLNGPLFFRLAIGILRNGAAAEDVCQQSLAKAWERREEIDGPAFLRGWLAKVVVNESLAIVRRQRTEKRVLALRAQYQETVTAAPGINAEVS